MEDKLIILNMKMFMHKKQIKDYIHVLKNSVLNENIVVCPTTIFIPYFIGLKCSIGIQNISQYTYGAFTGEVSARQCVDLGIKYAIIGHSERRQLFHETNEEIKKKVEQAINNKLKVVLCIGETRQEYNNHQTNKIIEQQLEEVYRYISYNKLKNIIVAYEPIWSIGTNNILNSSLIVDRINYIKDYIKQKFNIEPIVLYGGSVNSNNIKDLITINKLDGFLIGSASNSLNQFTKILEVVAGQ